MFSYLQHKDINKEKWDASIDACVNKNIYAYSWFLDAVSPQWAAIVSEDYHVVMPLPAKVKFGVHYIFQPFFSQQLGAFFKNEKSAADILQAIPAFYKYVELKLNKAFHPNVDGFDVFDNTNYTLSLNKPYELLFKSYAYNTKRNIKKCAADLICTNAFDDKEAIAMFELNKGATLVHFKKESHTVLLNLIEVLRKRNALEKWAVTNREGKLLAAAHFAVFENKRIFLFSATDEAGKKERAMFFLFDRFISKYAETNRVIDFSGSNDVQLARFYSGFGSEKEIYKRIKKNNLPFFMRWLKR